MTARAASSPDLPADWLGRLLGATLRAANEAVEAGTLTQRIAFSDINFTVHESGARAVATAGSAVVLAGLTVVIALVGLLITGIPFLSAMGLGAAFTMVVACSSR